MLPAMHRAAASGSPRRGWWRRRARTCRRSPALPVPEGGQQLSARLDRDVRFSRAPDRVDRAAPLLEVPLASVAEVQVLFEQRCLTRRQGPLEIVGGQLDDLLAAQMLMHRDAS